jgi:hypothetical protein
MKTSTILSQFQPIKKLVSKVLALVLDNRFLGYLKPIGDPLPFLFAGSKIYMPCAPQYSDIKQ